MIEEVAKHNHIELNFEFYTKLLLYDVENFPGISMYLFPYRILSSYT